MTTSQTITVTTSRESFEDEDAAFDRYLDACAEAVAAAYPGHTVTVEEGIGETRVHSTDDSVSRDDVREMVQDVWTEGAFWEDDEDDEEPTPEFVTVRDETILDTLFARRQDAMIEIWAPIEGRVRAILEENAERRAGDVYTFEADDAPNWTITIRNTSGS